MRERIVRFFVGSIETVEQRLDEFLSQPGIMVCDRVTVRHWGTDPVSVMVYAERDQGDPEVMEHVNTLIASMRLDKGVTL